MIIVSSAYFLTGSEETTLAILSSNGWTSLTLCCLFLVVSMRPWATLLAVAESFLVIYSCVVFYLYSKSIYIEYLYDFYPLANTLVYVLEMVVLGSIAVREVKDAARNYLKNRDIGDHMELSHL